MKKAVCFVVLLLALLGVGACGRHVNYGKVYQNGKPMEAREGTIFVNGEELKGEHALIYCKEGGIGGCLGTGFAIEAGEAGYWAGTELPFTAIVKANGFEVTWLDETRAELTFQDRIFHLDLEKIVVSDERGWDMLIGVPGAYQTYTVAERELFLDCRSVEGFFEEIGEDVMRYKIDTRGLRVDVTFQTESPAQEG